MSNQPMSGPYPRGDFGAYRVDRPRGCLTERDRKYILGLSEVEEQSQYEREIRRDIRNRMWEGLLDLAFIPFLDDRDKKQIFDAEDMTLEETEAQSKAFLALIGAVYRFAGGEDKSERARREMIEAYLADVIANYEAEQGSAKNGRLVLERPEVSVEISHTRAVDLDRLGEKLEEYLAGVEDVNDWPHEPFTVAELQFLLYYTRMSDNRIDQVDPLERWATAGLCAKFRETWLFARGEDSLDEYVPFDIEPYTQTARTWLMDELYDPEGANDPTDAMHRTRDAERDWDSDEETDEE